MKEILHEGNIGQHGAAFTAPHTLGPINHGAFR